MIRNARSSMLKSHPKKNGQRKDEGETLFVQVKYDTPAGRRYLKIPVTELPKSVRFMIERDGGFCGDDF